MWTLGKNAMNAHYDDNANFGKLGKHYDTKYNKSWNKGIITYSCGATIGRV